jgi:hypothetical protein
MKNANRKKSREIEKKQKARRRFLVIGGVALAIIAVIAVVLLLVKNPANASGGLMGDEVAIPSRDHVPNDTVPGPYNSNPPAGGAHYATDFPAKFYQEADLATLPKNPQGYLVHNLEHGYVIFWYNCQAPNTDCAALKQTIQQVMDETGGIKLIAFPWSVMDIPLAMTSWGRILKFPSPNADLMKQFVERNRYQAPEPDAP